VAALRADLFKLRQSPAVIKAFLAKPSMIQLVGYPDPSTKHYAAFCFLFGYTIEASTTEPYPAFRSLDEENLGRFLNSAVSEGCVGRCIDEP
jgi:hypothetical protein